MKYTKTKCKKADKWKIIKVAKPKKKKIVNDLINYYHISQLQKIGTEYSSKKGNWKNGNKKIVENARKAIVQDLSIYDKNGIGHEILLKKLEYAGKNGYFISAYDPNNPKAVDMDVTNGGCYYCISPDYSSVAYYNNANQSFKNLKKKFLVVTDFRKYKVFDIDG